MQFSTTTIFKFLLLAAGLMMALPGFSATITATGNGAWNATGTWDTGTIPTASDDVIIPVGRTVDVPSGLAIEFASLAINGPGDYNAASARGALRLLDGPGTSSILGPGTITSNGEIRIEESFTLSCDIVSNDRFQWSFGDITGSGSPTFTNNATGRLNMGANPGGNGTSSGVDFDNYGLMLHTGGVAKSITISGPVTNRNGGEITVQNSGKEVAFTGNFINESGALARGQFGGTFTLSGNVTNNGTIITPSISGGTFNGTGSFEEVNGAINTFFDNVSTVGPNACFSFSGGSGFAIDGTYSVDILGTTACADYAQLTTAGIFRPEPNSVLDLDFGSFTPTSSDLFTIVVGNGTDAVSGTFGTVNGLPTGYEVKYDFPNTGDVSVGDINYTPPPQTFISVQSGNWNDPATWDVNAVPTLNDNVTIDLSHTVDVPSGLAIEFASLAINGPGDYTAGSSRGTLKLLDGPGTSSILGPGTITSNGEIRIEESFTLSCDIVSNDRFQWSFGDITGSGSPTFTNNATGRLNMGANPGGNGTSSGVDFDNYGLMLHTGGVAKSITISGPVTNRNGGEITVQNSGKEVAFTGNFINESGALARGQFGGTFTLSGNVTNNGTIITPSISGGTFNGTGSFEEVNGAINTFFDNVSTVGPNACFSFSGGSGFAIDGTYSVDILGTTACADYAQLTTAGIFRPEPNSVLDLDFGSFTPTSSDLFTIVVGNGTDAVSGTFGTVNGLPTGYEVKYDFPNTGDVSVGDVNFGVITALDFVVATPTAGPNNTVVVEVSVNNFTDIGAYQGTINFDPSVLSYVSNNSPQANVQNIVGTPGAGGGAIPNSSITFAWFDASGNSVSLSDGTVVLELTFTVDANAPTGLTPITIDGSTTSLGFSTASGTSLSTPTVTNGGVNVDADPIVVDPVSIVSNNANTAYAKVGDEIILTFTTDEAPAVGPNVSIDKGGAGAVTVTDLGGGTSWEARKTVAAGDDGLVTFTIDVEDQYGNATTTTATTDATSVTVDTEAPVITCPTIPATDAPSNLCEAQVNFANATYTDANPGAAATQTVGDPSGSSFPVGTTTLTFEATDLAGNSSSCDVDVVVNDVTPPTMLTKAFTLTLDANGDGTVLPDDVDNGSNDACGIVSRTVTPNTFDCADEGTTVTVTLEATDANGLSNTETAQVTIQSVANASISGAANSRGNNPIPSVTFTATGTDGTQTATGSSYSFDFDPCNGVNEIIALRDNDATLNGVTSLDASLVAQHVTFNQLITGEYNLLAADVNNTNTINIADAQLIAQRVAGIRSAFADPNAPNPGMGGASTIWAFVPSDFTFANPAAPFSYTAARSYTFQTPLTGQDFVGVKMGDVDGDWDTNQSRRAAPSDSIHFVMEQVAARGGDLISVPVSVRNFTGISALQYSMEWDASVLLLKSVNHKAIEAVYNMENAENGRLSSAWFDLGGQSVSIPDGRIAFELVFEVVGPKGSATDFEITSTPTMAEAYDLNRERLGIGTKGSVEVGAIATNIGGAELEGYSLSQNSPNPFAGLTTINFSLGQSEMVQIEIYNTTGQVVKSFTNRYVAGSHEIKWDGSSQSGMKLSAGVYLVRMQAGEFLSTIKMKKID